MIRCRKDYEKAYKKNKIKCQNFFKKGTKQNRIIKKTRQNDRIRSI